MEIDSIIFDLDGTLWDSTDVVLKSWNEVLQCIDKDKHTLSKEQLMGVMGLQLRDIGKEFFPDYDERHAMEIMKKCIDMECIALRNEGGKLYPKLNETLIKLSNKYPLFIVSNCNGGYIEVFLEHHKLDKCFKDFICAGETGLPKGESIKSLIHKYKLNSPVYVGDTKNDFEASKLAGIPFVYASYGFGDVESYDYKISKFEDLIELII